jgi:uncharacterized membrane protein YgcG
LSILHPALQEHRFSECHQPLEYVLPQIAVAIMQRFQDVPDKDDEQAAEAFAHALHAKWGVGRRDCQNGVLLLLAIQNRQLYISTGAGAKPLLSWDALGNIISRARPLLRAGE